MADQKKKKRPRFVTAIGVARYPYLVRADTKWEKRFGVYRTELILDEEDAKPILDGIKKSMKEAKAIAAAKLAEKEKPSAKAKKIAATMIAPPYEVDDDGKYIFRFKTRAGGERRDGTEWHRTIPIFDSKGEVINRDLRLGGGSKIRVSYEFNPFFMAAQGFGVKLELKAAQLIELVEWGANAESYGFDEVEDGFESETDEFAEGEEGSEFPSEKTDDGDDDEESGDDLDF